MSERERFMAARIERGFCARFMAIGISKWVSLDAEDEWYDDPGIDDPKAYPVYSPVGGKQPSTFKTYRNARRSVGDDGFVLAFDLRSLPLVEQDSLHAADSGNTVDEEAFAERQMLYWERELSEIRKRKP